MLVVILYGMNNNDLTTNGAAMYYLFASASFNPAGAATNFVASYETLHKAKIAAAVSVEMGCWNWAQVVEVSDAGMVIVDEVVRA